jgi:1,4-alpha-glucan branching enzyme
MTQATIETRSTPFPGAVDHDGEVTFSIYAPGKKLVRLIGDFNDWRLDADPMREISPGFWSISRVLPRGTFEYQFVIDDSTIICDPYARQVNEDFGGQPRAIVRPRESPYVWRNDQWARPDYKDLVIYEMHIGDYTPDRTFIGAIKRLDHVRDLGVNAIELMPVFGVREDAGWGYSPTYLFGVTRRYGTPNELRQFIDEAHGKGMAVILDMVLAHTGHEHPFNLMYPYEQSPWYGPGVKGSNEFGFPQFDYSKEPTRYFVKDVLEYWLADFHVDGFRFDYLKNIGSYPGNHGIATLAWAARQTSRNAYLIGEDLPEEPDVMIDAGMDGAWHVTVSYALKALLCGKPKGDYDPADFDRCVSTFDPMASGYDRKPSMMVNYLESHDEERIVLEALESGFDATTAKRLSALGASVIFTLPGVPMLYQGQGWGESRQKNIDHNILTWEELETPEGRDLKHHYRRLVNLRRNTPALRTGNFKIEQTDPAARVVVYHRWNDAGGDILVAVNFSNDKRRVKLHIPSPGIWCEFFTECKQHDGEATIELPPYGAAIYIKQ